MIDCASLNDCAIKFTIGNKQIRITIKHMKAIIQSPTLVAFDLIIILTSPYSAFAEFFRQNIGRNHKYYTNCRLEKPDCRGKGQPE